MSGQQIEALLMRHGIKIWDRGLHDKYTLYFCVKRRQVAWAEYLMERAGVDLVSQHDTCTATHAVRCKCPNARRYGANARAKGLTREPPVTRPLPRFFAARMVLKIFLIGGLPFFRLVALACYRLSGK